MAQAQVQEQVEKRHKKPENIHHSHIKMKFFFYSIEEKNLCEDCVDKRWLLTSSQVDFTPSLYSTCRVKIIVK